MKGWHRAVLIILPYFLIVGLLQLVGAFLLGIDLSSDSVQQTSEQHFVITLFGLIGTFTVLIWFMKTVDRELFINLGFYFKNLWKDLAMGVLLGFLIMASGYLTLVYFGLIVFEAIVFEGYELLLTFLVFLFVAVSEEMLFRGYILRNLATSSNRSLALVLSSLLFAFFHSANPNLTWISYTNLFLAGILLGLLYLITKNLWFPIGLHLGWNFFQTFFGFKVSGIEAYSSIQFKMIEKNMFNGGDFGFEGSILSILIQIALIFAIIFIEKKSVKRR